MTVSSSSSSSKENAADHLQVSCPAACSYLEGRRSNTPNVDDDDVFLAALLEEEESEDPPLLEKVMVFGSQLRGWFYTTPDALEESLSVRASLSSLPPLQ